jgi:hypothetical protein
LTALASSPGFARANLIEIQNVGDQGHAKRNELIEDFVVAYRRLFEIAAEQEPGTQVPSRSDLFMLVSGQDQLQCAYIREDRTTELPSLEDAMFEFAVSVFLGTSHKHAGGQNSTSN